jgi:hypothetical protein
MGNKIGIFFGALAPPLVEQLIEQKVVKIPDNINTLQKLSDAVTLLAVHGMLSDSETYRVRNRLLKKIAKG